ncbi:MAG: UvrD-helicase domain-containing protein, partial [Elusimicrobia bacterium]|nr:UvrD-helicase domain-containing protein [Elusimicrobiota bacterium]
MKSNFIALEASAGSGKTHNLTKRYISLLLNFDVDKQAVVPLQNILALTFTNKATCEMKERIIDSLKKIALNYDCKNLTEDINLSKNKISQNAVIAINNLIKNYDKFNVRTTDSFINLIIKACALKLGISPNYKILDSYDEYIDYATDAFLNEVSVNKDVEDILNRFFDQFVLDSTNSWNIKGFILNKFKEFYSKDMSMYKISFDEQNQYLKVLKILSAKFNNLCMQMTKIKEFAGLNERFKTVIEEKVRTNAKYLFQPVRNLSSFFQKETLPYTAKKPKSAELDELFEKAKKVMKEFFEYRAFRYYDTYLQVFNYIVDEFDKRSQKDSVLFLQDINRKILKIFQSSLLPEIYYRLSNNFKDFLVDEFQDTNIVQWETLKLIVEENLSQNGSFFYVGDKKQAIYGFRGSDFRIF